MQASAVESRGLSSASQVTHGTPGHGSACEAPGSQIEIILPEYAQHFGRIADDVEAVGAQRPRQFRP